MNDEIFGKVQGIVAEQAMLDKDEVKPESTPEELGLDSLAVVEIIFAIEEEFGVSVPYNANDPEDSDFDISTIGKVTEAVEKLVAEKG